MVSLNIFLMYKCNILNNLQSEYRCKNVFFIAFLHNPSSIPPAATQFVT